MRFSSRLMRSVVLGLAAFAGSILALQAHHRAFGGTENIRWQAAVSSNLKWCFGRAGWHDGGYAADVFADA